MLIADLETAAEFAVFLGNACGHACTAVAGGYMDVMHMHLGRIHLLMPQCIPQVSVHGSTCFTNGAITLGAAVAISIVSGEA